MDEILSPEDMERMAAEAGLTIKELMTRAGVSHTTFYRWRAGKTQPTIRLYRRIRDALNEASAA